MLHNVFKAKIHRATVTEANLHYEGSCTIDMDLLDKAGIFVNEQVHIVNINNGDRIITYVIPGERGTGTICLNGAAARNAQVGDKIIIMSYALINDDEISSHKPRVVVLDEKNQIKE
jgi:aspartate 1-decarboxylase